MNHECARVRSRWLAICATLFALGCSRQHTGPEVGDSVTNWLQACNRDSECRGGTQCINSVCTVTCSNAIADTCTVLSSSAICEPSALVCDQPCADTRACDAISPSLSCREGRCREAAQQSALTPTGADASAPTTPRPIVNGLPLNTSEPVVATFDKAGAFKLIEGMADLALAWSGDHWNALWFSGLEPDGTTRPVVIARITPNGKIDRRTTSLSDVPASFTFASANGDGRFALLSSDGSSRRCMFRVVDPTADVQSVPIGVPCDDGISYQQVAAIPHQDEWLVAWRWPASPGSPVSIARYAPDSSAWSVGPWQFESGSGLPAIAVSEGGNAWLWSWDKSTGDVDLDIRRLNELTASREIYEALVPSMSVPYPFTGPIAKIVPTASGALVIAVQNDAMSATELRGDGRSAVPIPLPGLPTRDVDLNALYIPEQRRIVLCVAGQDLQLHILNEQGSQLMSPVVVDADRDHSACRLAWSGSDLLVAWATTLYDETRFPISWDTWARVVPASSITP